MSKWLAVAANDLNPLALTSGQVRFITAGGGNLNATEANVQDLMRASYTASNLWANCTAITGTLTVISRVGGGNGNQSLSITTTGTSEDTSHNDSLVSGNLYNYQCTQSTGISNGATLTALSTVLDDNNNANAPLLSGSTQTGWSTSAQFSALTGMGGISTTEANVQLIVRATVTFSNFRINLSANTFAATTTWRTRKNTVNGGQLVSYGAAVTGAKEDITNTDSTVAGDLICWGKDSGGTSGAATSEMVQVQTNVSMTLLVSTNAATTVYTTGNFGELNSSLPGLTTESNANVKARTADVFKNLQCNVTANSTASATTVVFRVGNASPGGGPSISIAAGSTGLKEDLSGSYTSATTDLLDYQISPTSGLGIILSTLGVQQGQALGKQATVADMFLLFTKPPSG